MRPCCDASGSRTNLGPPGETASRGYQPENFAGQRFWPISEDEARGIERIFATEDVRLLVTALRSRENDARVEVLDAAYWMKGCSSLGRLRFAVLLGVGKSHTKEGGLCLIDIKKPVQAAAPRHPEAAMPADHGMRVVEGARHLSPALGDRMVGATFLDRAIFMRELLPEDLKLEIDQISREEAMKAARYLAMVVGKAHARQLDVVARAKWRDELGRNRSANLDAQLVMVEHRRAGWPSRGGVS